jgi:hypothetical protein
LSLAFTNKGQCSFWLQCSLEYGCNCKTYRLDHRKCPKAIDTLALSITLLLTGSMIEYRYWIGILIFCQTSTYICILTCGWTRTCHRVTFIVIKKPSLKIGSITKLVVLILKPVNSWFSSYFFRSKTFLFVKIDSWKFQISFWLTIS